MGGALPVPPPTAALSLPGHLPRPPRLRGQGPPRAPRRPCQARPHGGGRAGPGRAPRLPVPAAGGPRRPRARLRSAVPCGGGSARRAAPAGPGRGGRHRAERHRAERSRTGPGRGGSGAEGSRAEPSGAQRRPRPQQRSHEPPRGAAEQVPARVRAAGEGRPDVRGHPRLQGDVGQLLLRRQPQVRGHHRGGGRRGGLHGPAAGQDGPRGQEPPLGDRAHGAGAGHRLVPPQRQRHRQRLRGHHGDGVADPRPCARAQPHGARGHAGRALQARGHHLLAPHGPQRPAERGQRQPGDPVERGHGGDAAGAGGHALRPHLQRGLEPQRQPARHHLQGQARARHRPPQAAGCRGAVCAPRRPAARARHLHAPRTHLHHGLYQDEPAGAGLVGPEQLRGAHRAAGDGHEQRGAAALLRRRLEHRVPVREGRQQHPLLRDHGRGALRALPEHLQQQGAAARHGLHAQARAGRQQVRDRQVLQAARAQVRAHRHDGAAQVRPLPGRPVPRHAGPRAGPRGGRVAGGEGRGARPHLAARRLRAPQEPRAQGGQEEHPGQPAAPGRPAQPVRERLQPLASRPGGGAGGDPRAQGDGAGAREAHLRPGEQTGPGRQRHGVAPRPRGRTRTPGPALANRIKPESPQGEATALFFPVEPRDGLGAACGASGSTLGTGASPGHSPACTDAPGSRNGAEAPGAERGASVPPAAPWGPWGQRSCCARPLLPARVPRAHGAAGTTIKSLYWCRGARSRSGPLALALVGGWGCMGTGAATKVPGRARGRIPGHPQPRVRGGAARGGGTRG